MAATSLDSTFAALADPTRVEIVTMLRHGPASVSELAAPFDMSLRAVLKHIHVLEEAGVVHTVKAGRVRRCSLQRDRVDQAGQWINELRRTWNRRIDRLERYLDHEGDQ